ncbi:MAG: hypothetical protein RBR08_09935 [Desulforegulaceae bacterium]|jgi:hypothetical protein|nr:hypothetical protein [Desulforegulaceae bacterium]
MFFILLQVWGGLFYLLNKLFFSMAERSSGIKIQQKARVYAWIVYLAGLPAWVFVFIMEHNWIAAAVESSGVPAMIMGLYYALKEGREKSNNKVLDYLSRFMIAFGLGLSLYDFGGLTTINQLVELGVALGFIFGTYFLAKFNSQGYFWFMLGNISAALLMMRQGYYVLMSQQLFSLILVLDAYFVRKRKEADKSSGQLQVDIDA